MKIREGQVTNRPIYVVVGINCQGERDVLGLWVGTGGEGAKHWMNVLTELRNRGVADVLIACCDGLKGLPEAISEVWPLATVQECVVHLVRSSLRYASRAHWSAITKALRTIYTGPTVDAAEARFIEFDEVWGVLIAWCDLHAVGDHDGLGCCFVRPAVRDSHVGPWNVLVDMWWSGLEHGGRRRQRDQRCGASVSALYVLWTGSTGKQRE